jgi:hypothetical protein
VSNGQLETLKAEAKLILLDIVDLNLIMDGTLLYWQNEFIICLSKEKKKILSQMYSANLEYINQFMVLNLNFEKNPMIHLVELNSSNVVRGYNIKTKQHSIYFSQLLTQIIE